MFPSGCCRSGKKPAALCVFLAVAATAATAAVCTGADARSEQPQQSKPQQEGFVGQYVGSLQPLGEFVTDPETGKKQFQEKKCDSCHVEASVDRVGDGYRLTMMVDHGKDKEGKPRVDKVVLEGSAADGVVRFIKAPWSITLRSGEASGKYTGRKLGEIKLKRKTDAPSGETPKRTSVSQPPGK